MCVLQDPLGHIDKGPKGGRVTSGRPGGSNEIPFLVITLEFRVRLLLALSVKKLLSELLLHLFQVSLPL